MSGFYCIVLFFLALFVPNFADYEANWDSLDSRPLPTWFDKAKIGIFIHWGVYSVPSFGSEWFWPQWKNNVPEYVEFMKKNYPKDFSYQEFAKDFTAEFFDANEWAELFAKSGAKYVVLTSKHHDGFTLWPSIYSYSWNSVDVGPHRDIVGELGEGVRAKNLTYGLYHSLLEWYHPLYEADRSTGFSTQVFSLTKVLPEMKELIETYKPDILWSDGDWEQEDTYWNAAEFLAWLYNESPVKDNVVTNDRWGLNINCAHGGYFTCNDRYNPGTLQKKKWENAMTIDTASWGYRRNAKLQNYYSITDIIYQLVTTVSCGGNLLLNIGPSKEGTIPVIFEERLTQLGQWLGINGEAIYESQPWTAQNDSLSWGVWYTSKDTTVYAIVVHWTWYANTLNLGSVVELFQATNPTVTMLGNEDDGKLEWNIGDDMVNIVFPPRDSVASDWAWVLKIQPR